MDNILNPETLIWATVSITIVVYIAYVIKKDYEKYKSYLSGNAPKEHIAAKLMLSIPQGNRLPDKRRKRRHALCPI